MALNEEYHFGKRVNEMKDSHLINAYKYYRLKDNLRYAVKFYNELKWRYPNTIRDILKDI